MGVEHNTIVYGSVNTAVLLVSSFTIALAVHELRRGGPSQALRSSSRPPSASGSRFLAIKAAEYLHHFDGGHLPRRGRALLRRAP